MNFLSKLRKELHSAEIRRCRSSCLFLSPAQQPSSIPSSSSATSSSVREREGVERAAGQTIRVRPPSSPLLSSPTHHAHYFLKIWNQTDGQTDRDGGGDGGGGMALPKNGKSPMQKGESKKGLYRRAPKRYSRFRAECDQCRPEQQAKYKTEEMYYPLV